MQQMRASHCLTEMADFLAVSKSGFFAHQRKGERPRVRQDKELSQAIEPIFVASRKTYSSPRIMHALRRSGCRCGKNRIARLMRSRGLRARQKRRFKPQTTRSDHKLPMAPNWLARIPKPDRPGQVWLAPILPASRRKRVGSIFPASWTIVHDAVSVGTRRSRLPAR